MGAGRRCYSPGTSLWSCAMDMDRFMNVLVTFLFVAIPIGLRILEARRPRKTVTHIDPQSRPYPASMLIPTLPPLDIRKLAIGQRVMLVSWQFCKYARVFKLTPTEVIVQFERFEGPTTPEG